MAETYAYNVYRNAVAGQKLRDEFNRLQRAAFDGKTDEEERARANRKLLLVRRNMEDLENEVRKIIGKKQEQHVIDLYTEVQNAVKQYAGARDEDACAKKIMTTLARRAYRGRSWVAAPL